MEHTLCTSVSLEYLLDLVTHCYMLLNMVFIVYHFAFVNGAVACDLIGQLFAFAV